MMAPVKPSALYKSVVSPLGVMVPDVAEALTALCVIRLLVKVVVLVAVTSGAADVQVVPFEVSTLPVVPGATNSGELVPLPRRTLLTVRVVAPVPPRATLNVPVVPATIGKFIALIKLADDGVPSAGVTNAGLVANTKAPEPVSFVTAAAKLALDGVAKNVATPALSPDTPVVIGKPVPLVRTTDDGVPRAGVTSVGLVAKTKAPVPVSFVTAAARLAEDGVAKNVATPALSPDTPVVIGKPVPLVRTTDDGVPSAGVTSAGLVAKTKAPVPVSFVTAAAKSAELNEPSTVALPVEVTAPVRLAFVVTFPAVRPAAVPVMFVPTNADGVPSAGVTSVGLVAKTKAPVPVSFVTAAARLAEDGVAKNVATPALSPDTPVVIGKPVPLVKTTDEGVPRAGVTRAGLVANTKAPEPVSFVTAAAKLADVGVPRKVATPAPKEVIPVPPLATGSVPVTSDARFTVGLASVTAAPAPAPSVTIIIFWPVGIVTVAPEPCAIIID